MKRDWFHEAGGEILIERAQRQRLGDISEEDARAEGFGSREEFFKAWREIHGSLNLDEEVWVYEFRLVKGKQM